MEMEGRIAEIDALCRDYLLVGDISDHEDVEAFISSLSSHGLPVGDSNAASFVKNRLIDLDSLARSERDAMHSMPNSWRERKLFVNSKRLEACFVNRFRKFCPTQVLTWLKRVWHLKNREES